MSNFLKILIFIAAFHANKLLSAQSPSQLSTKITLYFSYDSDKINPDQVSSIEKIISKIKSHPESKVNLVGFSDSHGATDYNKNLANRRVIKIYNILIKNGVPQAQLSIEAKGSTQLIDSPSHDTEKEKENRRVEVCFQEAVGSEIKQAPVAVKPVIKEKKNKIYPPKKAVQKDVWSVEFGGGIAKPILSLSKNFNAGKTFYLSAGKELTTFENITVSLFSTLEFSNFSKETLKQTNSLSDKDAMFSARLAYPIFNSWQFFGDFGLGLSSWTATAEQKITQESRDNNGLSFLMLGGLGLSVPAFDLCNIIVEVEFHHIFGNFKGGYLPITVGVNLPLGNLK